MQNVQSNVQSLENSIELSAQIALRHATNRERGTQLLALATFLKFGVVWRTTLHSPSAAKQVWSVLAGTKGFDMESVISMTNEFIVRSAQISDYLIEILAQSLSWTNEASAVPNEVMTLTGKVEAYKTTLTYNPWLVFLYLLSMTDFIQRVSAINYPPEPRVPRGENA